MQWHIFRRVIWRVSAKRERAKPLKTSISCRLVFRRKIEAPYEVWLIKPVRSVITRQSYFRLLKKDYLSSYRR